MPAPKTYTTGDDSLDEEEKNQLPYRMDFQAIIFFLIFFFGLAPGSLLFFYTMGWGLESNESVLFKSTHRLAELREREKVGEGEIRIYN